MRDAVELHQLTISPADLPFKLAQAAEGNPQVDYHAVRGDGGGWFAELWALVRHDPRWVSTICQTLAEFLAAGTSTRCQFAVAAAGVAAQAVDPATLLGALGREDIDDATRAAIALHANHAMLAGAIVYSPSLRPWVAAPATNSSLLAAAWVFDHDWVIGKLSAILPEGPDDAAFACAMALAQLRRAEWDLAVDDIHAARGALGEARADAIVSRLSRSRLTVDGSAAHRQGPARWCRSNSLGPDPK